MSITVKSVTGLVVTPDGVGWAGGVIVYRLNIGRGSVDDAGTEQVIIGTKTVPIGYDGGVAFDIVPNDIISPADSVYIVTFISPDKLMFTERWKVYNADPSPIDIGDIERPSPESGGWGPGTLAALDDTDVSGVGDGEVLTYDSLSGTWKPEIGVAGEPVVPLVGVLPTPDSSYRGKMRRLKPASLSEETYICLGNYDLTTFTWKKIIDGEP